MNALPTKPRLLWIWARWCARVANPAATHARCRRMVEVTSSASPKPSPSSKPKRKQPLRSIQMLMLANDHGELLLQRRPPTGIWGGLLSFPEIPVDENVDEWCKQHIGSISDLLEHPTLQHVFSHFRLHIQPVSARLTKPKPQLMDDQSWLWFKPGVSVIGLAAPVNQLMQKLALKPTSTIQ